MNFDLHEEAIYSIVAGLRFPGPNYYKLLQWLHEELNPATYLEIGVHHGHSLKLATPPTLALGIDPFLQVKNGWEAQTQVLQMTSAEFFANHKLSEFFGEDRFSLAFVDGLHHFEQVIEDILNLEGYAGLDSVIAIHDTIPLDEKTAMRERGSLFYTGDVWKVIPFLKEVRPDLELVTVRTGPSGLTLIRRLNPSWRMSKAESKALIKFQRLPWEYYAQHRNDFLKTIPNERGAVVQWLDNWNQ